MKFGKKYVVNYLGNLFPQFNYQNYLNKLHKTIYKMSEVYVPMGGENVNHHHYHYHNNSNEFGGFEEDLQTSNQTILETILIIFGSILFVQCAVITYLVYHTHINNCWKKLPNKKRTIFKELQGEMNHEMTDILSQDSENSSVNETSGQKIETSAYVYDENISRI